MKRYSLLLIGLALQFVFFNCISLAQEGAKTCSLRGVIMGGDSYNVLARAAPILCQSQIDGECSIRADLTAISDESGRFAFLSIPQGKYVLLYDPLGKAVSTWKTIVGLTINFELGKPKDLASFITKEYYQTFGGSVVPCRTLDAAMRVRVRSITYHPNPRR